MTFTNFISSSGDNFSLNILMMKRLSSSLNFLARALVIGPCISNTSVWLSDALSSSQNADFFFSNFFLKWSAIFFCIGRTFLLFFFYT